MADPKKIKPYVKMWCNMDTAEILNSVYSQ